VHGGLTGLFLGNVTVDLPLSDTYFVIGHFHMVMGVSPVMVLFKGRAPNDTRAPRPSLPLAATAI
jgi:heme/copper-type cytochrome/quinol oxidase subunit 1